MSLNVNRGSHDLDWNCTGILRLARCAILPWYVMIPGSPISEDNESIGLTEAGLCTMTLRRLFESRAYFFSPWNYILRLLVVSKEHS